MVSAMNAYPSSLSFTFPGSDISFGTSFAKINGEERKWVFSHRVSDSLRLGGIDGARLRETYLSDDGRFSIVREVWTALRGGMFAYRYITRNLTDKPIPFSSVRVVDAAKGDIDLAGASPLAYRAFLDQASCMTAIPASVRLGVLDDAFREAAAGIYWSRDEHEQMKASAPTKLSFSNFCLLDGGADASAKLLVGFIELAHHYADMEIAVDPGKRGFASLTADAVFNCELPPHGERATQFVAVLSMATYNETLAAYDELVGQLANIAEAPSEQPPSVGCTWHYYGSFIDEKTVLDNIKAASKRNIPLDYYLIDDFWEPCYGDWQAVPERFPHGMRFIADKIREAGMRPGIWSSPFAAKPTSETARLHDAMFLRDANGKKIDLWGDYMIDPTYPGALRWIEDLYRRLHQDYGFEYFKLDKSDFASAEFRQKKAVCHDRSVTLVEAYRRAIAAVRAGVGPESYICICGGHYGASLGLCDTQRCSADTYGRWYGGEPGENIPLQEMRLKQILGRIHNRRLFHTNPDGLELRYQEKSLDPKDFGLSVGHFTMDEALQSAALTYVTGGIVMCGESLVNIGGDRLALYRHVVPSLGAASRAVDFFHEGMPTQFVTHVKPCCSELGPWNTVAIFNVAGKASASSFRLAGDVTEQIEAPVYLVFENITGTFLGRHRAGSIISLKNIPGHGVRIVKVIPIRKTAGSVYLLGTDLHFSGGGVEISYWNEKEPGAIKGEVSTPWTQCAILISACKCDSNGKIDVHTLSLQPGNKRFAFYFP